MDFSSHRSIRATRKPHLCEQCGRAIEVGSPAEYAAGRYEGEFYSQHFHAECHAAAMAYAELHDCWGEDWPWFRHNEFEPDDKDWMREQHPIVADRLGWALPGEAG